MEKIYKSILWPFIWLYRSWTLSIGKWLLWVIAGVVTCFIILPTITYPALMTMSVYGLFAFLLFLFGIPFASDYERFLEGATAYGRHYSEPEPHFFLLPLMSGVIIAIIVIGLFLLIL